LQTMTIFHPLNSLFVSRNLWLILLSKILLLLNVVNNASKSSTTQRIPNLRLFFLQLT
jgi:hypothetical protein